MFLIGISKKKVVVPKILNLNLISILLIWSRRLGDNFVIQIAVELKCSLCALVLLLSKFSRV